MRSDSVNWHQSEFHGGPALRPIAASELQMEVSEEPRCTTNVRDPIIDKEIYVFAGEHKGLYGQIKGANERTVQVTFEAKQGGVYWLHKDVAVFL